MDNLNSIIIHHRSSHHAKNSGYARLLDFIEATEIPSGRKVIPYKLAKLISKFASSKSGIFDSTSVLKEIELYTTLQSYKNKKNVVHYLNAERDIRLIAKYSSSFKNTSFCGTFHKPPNVLERTIKKTSYLQKLHGAIVVGANQVDFIKNWLNTDMVKYIPHGVDTTFFTPPTSIRKVNSLLFVGQHLRDFEALNYCVPRLAEKIKNLEVNIVLRKDFFKKINIHPSIKLHSDIDDTKLRTFYQEASALFLPMLNSTACNSILEALASGTPIITSNVGGNNEYLKGTKSIMAPINDFNYLIDATIDVLKNESKLSLMSAASRKKSQEYRWEKISEEVIGFHNLL